MPLSTVFKDQSYVRLRLNAGTLGTHTRPYYCADLKRRPLLVVRCNDTRSTEAPFRNVA